MRTLKSGVSGLMIGLVYFGAPMVVLTGYLTALSPLSV